MKRQAVNNTNSVHAMPSLCLGIETSCDETGVAIVKKESGHSPEVVKSLVASQIDIHALTGGVVPEAAAREHATVIIPLIQQALKEAKVDSQLIDAIAVTVAPGLMPALAVGVTAARALSYAWNKPIVPIHHLEGHIYSALLASTDEKTGQLFSSESNPFPALALIVSGGHTMLIMVTGHLQYEVVGTTRDDAAGEAFDKVARLLGLPYPGGPAISRAAENGSSSAFAFPRPMVDSGDLDFSFSGLKTAVLYTIREHSSEPDWMDQNQSDIAASFQAAVVETLAIKTAQALDKYEASTLLLAGGVAANKELRIALNNVASKAGVEMRVAPLGLCGDNAAMIGQIGSYAFSAGRLIGWKEADAVARRSIEDFSVQGSN